MSPASVFSCFRKGSFLRQPASPLCGSWLALAAACLAPTLARAQAPGTQDTTFVSAATGGTVYALAVEDIDQQDLVLVGGDTALLYRLSLVDGSYDTFFKFADFGNLQRIVYTAVEQIIPSDADQDKTLLGGLFGRTAVPNANGTSTTSTPAQNITRLNSDGTLDTTFNPGVGADNYVTAIIPEADGTIYVGGLFNEFNKIEHHHVLRLNIDGSIDTSFASNLQIDDNVLAMADQLDPVSGQPNGQILIAGIFNSVDKTATAKLARLNHDGTLDTSFNPVIDTRVDALAVQPDGKIIIGGEFSTINGTPVTRLARLNPDGSLDTTFSASVTGNPPGSPTTVAVYVIKILPRGRIYIGGNFDTVDGATRNYLARIRPDGSIDDGFDPGTAIINSVQSLAIQTNNEILVGETVSRKVNNVFLPSLIRLYGDPLPPTTGSSTTPPSITIEADKPDAAETSAAGTPVRGQFKLFRQGTNTAATVVYLKVSGSAVSGQDYRPLPLAHDTGNTYTATFQPGQTVLKIGVRPTGDTLTDSPETVTLRVKPDQSGTNAYTRGSSAAATVAISNASGG